MYLEISPRGAGKTFKIKAAVQSWLAENAENKAVIYCMSPTRTTWSNDPRIKFLEYSKENIQNTRYNAFDTRRFFDDFDYFNDVMLYNVILTNDYYASSSAKIRTIKDIKEDKDFLFKLLRLNNGNYFSSFALCLMEPSMLESIGYLPKDDSLKTEYGNMFFDITK